MSDAPEYGETWVYESIVGALPGLALPTGVALAVQFIGFEVAILALAWYYGLWAAVPAGTAAVVVATGGSAVMLWISRQVRRSDAPSAYRHLLFGSSIEVVLAVVAFIGFVTYVLVGGAAGEMAVLGPVLGGDPPALVVFLALLVAWDVSYRIATGWWASVVGCWRSLTCALDPATRRRLRTVDLANVGFAGLQLLLVPFLASDPLLALAVVGHVGATVLVSGLSVAVLSLQN